MKKLIIISIIIHIILIVVLAPVIKTRMVFDVEKEAERTAEVKQREQERNEQERIRREKQQLDEKTAKMLKREAEMRKKEEITREITELREKRDEMMERRKTELEQIRKRAAKDILASEQTEINKLAKNVQKHLEEALKKATPAEDPTVKPSELREMTTEVNATMDKLVEQKGDLTEIPELLTELDTAEKRISEQMEIEKAQDQVRSEMDLAKNDLRKAKEILAKMQSEGAKIDIQTMNDTSTAEADSLQPPPSADSATADASEMYQEASFLEKQIATAKADIDAAREAATQNRSYAEARKNAVATVPDRPDLASALSAKAPGTVGELNEFREHLNQAENEMQDMNARADSALGNTARRPLSAASFASGAAMSSAAQQSGKFGQIVDMTSFGNRDGSAEMREESSSEGSQMQVSEMPEALNIDEGKIISAAIPGRRFTAESLRKGWLYLDTWYVIGPWENNSRVDYTVKHPPEFGIDFDARYRDGKFANQPGHPYEILKWEFYQSDQVRCQPPKVFGASTYYAYTDVWFEEARDMLIAVASDDASSVWLNGQIIWQDTGQSAWALGEGYRKVHFNKGFNDILIRIENGPTHCVWSIVLCPPEMLNK